MLSKSFCVLQFTDYRRLSYYINFAFAILFPLVYADQQSICTETQLSAITTSELGRCGSCAMSGDKSLIEKMDFL
ncbi:hypothetical protein T11_9301 [Trichinella zimbabwensis]|uniref:Uncharacterized protein n=1 Tax=Trichinella zimbabwensis TaxID=268475 RepID=A0A0V1GJ18_9BILA|nr:hypothetical protein T11_9301 [Trichinella zimbabwensis]